MVRPYRTLSFPKGDHPLFPGRKQVDEHRVVMAEHLGRPLLRTEIVHHRKHKETRNNKISNLKLIPLGKHSRLHNKGRRQSQEERRKKSIALKGRKFTATHLRNMSLCRLGKTTITKAGRRKISLFQKGRRKSTATRLRMKQSWTFARRKAQAKRMAIRNKLRSK